jgi:hypothetical protein
MPPAIASATVVMAKNGALFKRPIMECLVFVSSQLMFSVCESQSFAHWQLADDCWIGHDHNQ